jgi:hypothetical protein
LNESANKGLANVFELFFERQLKRRLLVKDKYNIKQE